MNSMPNLKALNLKEVIIMGGEAQRPSGGTMRGENDEIPSFAFFYNKTLGTIVLPDLLTSIGEYSFNGCDNLKGSISIPEKVTIVKEAAFSGCQSLRGNLTLPKSLKTIEKHAFGVCGFEREHNLHRTRSF